MMQIELTDESFGAGFTFQAFIRSRPALHNEKSRVKDETELYLDPTVHFSDNPDEVVRVVPPDCCGILVSEEATGLLEVRYPGVDQIEVAKLREQHKK